MKFFIFLFFLGAMYFTSCTDGKQPTAVEKAKGTAEAPTEMVKRGEYLVAIMGSLDLVIPDIDR